jgi:hypothetical protein
MSARAAVLRPGLACAAVALAVAACSPQAPQTPKAPEARFDTGYPVQEMMAHAMEPAADRFWGGSGAVIDADGVHERRPTTPEAWKTLEDGAITTVELANALMLPGRVREPAADWNRYAVALIAVAKDAQVAAERQDDDQTLLEIGGRLYDACLACHEQFAPDPAEAPPATPSGEVPAQGAALEKR